MNAYNQPKLTSFEKIQILMAVKKGIEGCDELITPNDIFSVAGLNDGEIIDVVNHNIKDDISTQKGMNAFNYIFFKGLHAYSQTIGRLKSHKIDINNFDEFNTPEEIIDFLRVTEGEGKKARIHCAITRFSRAADNVLNAPTLRMLESKERDIIGLLKDPLYLDNVGDDYIGHFGGGKSRIDFILSSRSKLFLSSTRKGVHDPKYDKAEDIKDGVGMTFKTETWQSAIKLMSYIDSILTESNLSIKGKGKEIPDILKNMSGNLSIDFLKKLKEIDMTTKSGTSDGYIDIKLVGFIGGVPIEIKFVLLSSENEDGINFQPIYKGIKGTIEGELIRSMNGFATQAEIEEVAIDLIDNIQSHINESPMKRGTSIEKYYRELWLDLKNGGFIESEEKWAYIKTLRGKKSLLYKGLTDYYISKLSKKKLPGGKIVYVNERAENLSKVDFYPKFKDVD